MATMYPDVNKMKMEALQNFTKEFGENATVAAYAPGRVNLIGEHTDYNEGFVLPMALPLVTVIVGKPNESKMCTVMSMCKEIGKKITVEFDCTNKVAIKPGEPEWANYVKGCIVNFPQSLSGFNAIIVSSIPVGAGLSSSAALEVAIYTFLEMISGSIVKTEEKVLACQRVEHDFVGVSCGIMDQTISVMGWEGHALLLDCRDFTTKQIPIQLGDHVFIITNSNTPHKLSSSAYSKCRDLCFEAAKLLGKRSLRDFKLSDLDILKSMNANDEVLKSARHVITEIQRTLEAANSLGKNDIAKFGILMNESHNSLRDDFQVSSKELDSLVSIARGVNGVLGSRLTGAGYGGCTITLLRKNAVDNYIKQITENYAGTPNFYIAEPSNGSGGFRV